jgi:hypothetical protein
VRRAIARNERASLLLFWGRFNWKRFRRKSERINRTNSLTFLKHRNQLRFKQLSMAKNPSKPYLAGVTT